MSRSLLLDTHVAPGPIGAGEARRALLPFERSLPAALYSAVRLLVSQLVADSEWHPSPRAASLGLRVERRQSFVRVEVTGIESEAQPGPEQRAETGWDTFLLEAMSDRWGILTGTTSDVWFEIEADA